MTLVTRLAASEDSARERIAEARARWQQETTAHLAQAEATWRAEEAARLAAAAEQWRERLERTLAEATARFERAEAALAGASARAKGDDGELGVLRCGLAELKATLATREAELAEALHRVELAAAEQPGQRIEAALSAARTAWEAELEQRMAKATADAATTIEETRAALRAELDRKSTRLNSSH